jgi:hypothetical protein
MEEMHRIQKIQVEMGVMVGLVEQVEEEEEAITMETPVLEEMEEMDLPEVLEEVWILAEQMTAAVLVEMVLVPLGQDLQVVQEKKVVQEVMPTLILQLVQQELLHQVMEALVVEEEQVPSLEQVVQVVHRAVQVQLEMAVQEEEVQQMIALEEAVVLVNPDKLDKQVTFLALEAMHMVAPS